MTDVMVIAIIRDAVLVTLLVSAPVILVGLGIGITVSILQTAFSIQEQTLTFVPKVVGMGLTMVLLGNWMLRTILEYTVRVFQLIGTLGR